MALQFSINGVKNNVEAISPTTTVLDYIRDKLALTGTKEGCAEGDCGACTIVMAETSNGHTRYQAVNSCLLLLPQIAGKNIITVEGLENKTDENHKSLDPVQYAMAQSDGTQCGFCTPGFVMSLFALRKSNKKPTEAVIHDALAGNLCRCTGYRPIVDAAKEACVGSPNKDVFETFPLFSKYGSDKQAFYAPKNIEEMTNVYDANPTATILCGGTDVGLEVSKERKMIEEIIYTSHVAELLQITETETDITFGAAVTYSNALPYIEKLFPSFATLVTRIGSIQIRNVGTIGGNIGNASPIGDTLPCLIALDATITLCSKVGERSLAVGEFFLDYRKTVMKEGEFITNVRIPKLGPSQKFRTYKISKRYDQDISAVIGAYRLDFDGDTIAKAWVAYGGLAPIPKRASRCEKSLTAKKWNIVTLRSASRKISEDFQPISDFRATKDYRLKVAANLFERLYQDLENPGQPNDVVSL